MASKKEKEAFILELKKFLTQSGYTLDSFGHYVKDGGVQQIQGIDGTETVHYKYRYVFEKNVLRFERKHRAADESWSNWYRKLSGYYSELSISQDKNDNLKTKIFGMKR